MLGLKLVTVRIMVSLQNFHTLVVCHLTSFCRLKPTTVLVQNNEAISISALVNVTKHKAILFSQIVTNHNIVTTEPEAMTETFNNHLVKIGPKLIKLHL